jgi:hypothetical protein
MAYEPINLGDGISREPLGSALKKIDTMLSELYVTIPEGDFSAVSQNIVPELDLQYNLGSETNRWHSLYVGSGSVYIGDAKLSATTNGQIILPGVYDPSLHQAVEVYAESGVEQERTWGNPATVTIIDHFTWLALGGDPSTAIPAAWEQAVYSVTLEEGLITGGIVVAGGNEYSDIDINGINNVATICTDFMFVYIGVDPDPFAIFDADDWTEIPFAVRCQATGVNLSTTIGENVSYNNLLDLPDQNLNTTNSVEFLSVTAGSVETAEVAAAATLTLTAGSTSVTLNNQGVMTFPQILQFTSNNSSNSNVFGQNTTNKNFKYDDLGFISGMHSINFNMFFDTNRRHRIYFSLGGGIGPTFINFQNQNINGDVTINYNAIFQLNLRLSDHILIYGEYRYTFVQGRDYSLTKPITVVNYASTDTPALADNRSITKNSLSLKEKLTK